MKTVKFAAVALSLVAMTGAFAQEEVEATETIGWTPVVFGLATPVQMPFGMNSWDVYGFDFNLFYADAPKVRGVVLGGLATHLREDIYGMQFGGLVNLNRGDMIGLGLSLGCNFDCGKVIGAQFGGVGIRDELVGFDAELVGSLQRNFTGAQVALIANITKYDVNGASIAGFFNYAHDVYGMQLAGLFNMTEQLHGCQLGLVNFARECPCGFQFGLVNVILDNQVKVLPIINGFF